MLAKGDAGGRPQWGTIVAGPGGTDGEGLAAM